MVRPSEWRTTEVDLDGVIEVSEGDLEYWVRQQGAPPPAVIERQLMPRPMRNDLGRQVYVAQVCGSGLHWDGPAGSCRGRVHYQGHSDRMGRLAPLMRRRRGVYMFTAARL
jgi:hypothetical protein